MIDPQNIDFHEIARRGDVVATRSRIPSRTRGLSPGTFLRSSSDRKVPVLSRRATIRSASAGPIPGRRTSSEEAAVLRLILSAMVASASGWDPGPNRLRPSRLRSHYHTADGSSRPGSQDDASVFQRLVFVNRHHVKFFDPRSCDWRRYELAVE